MVPVKATKVSIKCDVKLYLVPRTVGNEVREGICKVLIETTVQRQGHRYELTVRSHEWGECGGEDSEEGLHLE